MSQQLAGAGSLGFELPTDLFTIIGLILLLISGAFERAIAEVLPPAPPARPSKLRLGSPRIVAMSDADAVEAARLLGSCVAGLVATDWDI